jgi:predicted DNA-binding transcriptional regulator AlpA
MEYKPIALNVPLRRLPARNGTSWPQPLSRVPKKPFLWDQTLKLLDLDELAALLGRSPETIKKDLRRNPLAVPPRLHIPGTRLLRWRECDVESWLAEHVAGGAR